MMAREIEEGTSANVDLSEAVDRAVLRWNERAAQRDSTVVAPGRRRGGTGRPDRPRPDPRQPARQRDLVRAGRGHHRIRRLQRTGLRRRAGPGTGHRARGPRARHRTLLSGARGALGWFGSGLGDRSTARREVGRHPERGEHARRRNEGGGAPGRGAVTFTSP